MLNVAMNEDGLWEVTYRGIFFPVDEARTFKTEKQARAHCERIAYEWHAMERREAHCDGAGFDNV